MPAPGSGWSVARQIGGRWRYCAAGPLAGTVGIAGAVVAPADAATGAAAGALAGIALSAPGSSYCG
ncbi:hypothetical protein, partial [Burkholderia stabilis]